MQTLKGRGPTWDFVSAGPFPEKVIRRKLMQNIRVIGLFIIISLFFTACETVRPGLKNETKEMGSPMIAVEAGSNAKGSAESDFLLGKTEVLQKDFMALMGFNPSKHQGDDLPVHNVTWYDALAYCNALSEAEGLQPCYTLSNTRYEGTSLVNADVTVREEASGYRLPEKKNWAYAAAGGKKTKGFKYSGSDNISDVCWYKENSMGSPHKSASKKANELGLYDMSGNVWEWTATASQNKYKVIYGGCWADGEDHAQVPGFNAEYPHKASPYVGFRVYRPATD